MQPFNRGRSIDDRFTGYNVVKQRKIRDAARERPNLVEQGRDRHNALIRIAVLARPKAIDAAHCGRHADRALGIFGDSNGAILAAMAAAVPPLLPPGMRLVS